jgi:hypothetical protein
VRGPSGYQGVRRLRSAASPDQDFRARYRWQAVRALCLLPTGAPGQRYAVESVNGDVLSTAVR